MEQTKKPISILILKYYSSLFNYLIILIFSTLFICLNKFYMVGLKFILTYLKKNLLTGVDISINMNFKYLHENIIIFKN